MIQFLVIFAVSSFVINIFYVSHSLRRIADVLEDLVNNDKKHEEESEVKP